MHKSRKKKPKPKPYRLLGYIQVAVVAVALCVAPGCAGLLSREKHAAYEQALTAARAEASPGGAVITEEEWQEIAVLLADYIEAAKEDLGGIDFGDAALGAGAVALGQVSMRLLGIDLGPALLAAFKRKKKPAVPPPAP